MSNLKFLGELYKLKMLTDGIACDCITKLLKDNDEVSLECLCTLVSAIGKQLELGIRKVQHSQLHIEEVCGREEIKFTCILITCILVLMNV